MKKKQRLRKKVASKKVYQLTPEILMSLIEMQGKLDTRNNQTAEYYEAENTKLMKDFEKEIETLFFNDGPRKKELEDFILKHKHLNGAIVICKLTDNLKEYVKAFGANLGNKEYDMMYKPINEVEPMPNITGYNTIINKYKTLTKAERNIYFLIQLQCPNIENPENCKDTIMLCKGLETINVIQL